MLPALYTTIMHLLHAHSRMAEGEVAVRFARPERWWVESLTAPTLCFFLFDMAESAEFRNASAQVTRSGHTATTRLAPRRFDLRYLVAAFADDEEDEQRLLWRTLATLLRHTTLSDRRVWPESLEVPATPVTARIGPYEGAPPLLDMWQALGLPPRAALLYTVTAPLDLEVEIEAPLVLSRRVRVARTSPEAEAAGQGIREPRLAERDTPQREREPLLGVSIDPATDLFDIGARVLDSSSKPVRGVRVSVVGRAAALTSDGRDLEAVTDDEGRFQLTGLRRGAAELSLAHGDRAPIRMPIQVPWAFDIDIDGRRTLYVIGGSARDRHGDPIPGVTIFLAGTALAAVTEADGHFVLRGVPAGEATIVAARPNHPPTQRTIPVPASIELVLD